MKIDLLQRRLFLDGYGSSEASLENIDMMCNILQRMNQYLFGSKGMIQMIPIADDNQPQNDGISGVILASGGAFTLHTFSKRRIFFADVYMMQEYDPGFVAQYLDSVFRPSEVDTRIDGSDAGFGRHVVMQLPYVDTWKHAKLVKQIIGAIEMEPLGKPMFFTKKGFGNYLQMITTSHVSLHNGPGYTVLDVFSCMDFDLQKLEHVLTEFGLTTHNLIGIGRGIKMDDASI